MRGCCFKSSHLWREKEGTRHGEVLGQDRGCSVCLLSALLWSSLPVRAIGFGARRDFSGAGWECPPPDCGTKAFLGGHGVTRRLRAATMHQARGSMVHEVIRSTIPYVGR